MSSYVSKAATQYIFEGLVGIAPLHSLVWNFGLSGGSGASVTDYLAQEMSGGSYVRKTTTFTWDPVNIAVTNDTAIIWDDLPAGDAFSIFAVDNDDVFLMATDLYTGNTVSDGAKLEIPPGALLIHFSQYQIIED